MKISQIILMFCFFYFNYSIAQDIELTEGDLRLTTFMGTGIQETAIISNASGIINLNPAPGHQVRVEGPHDFEVQSGDFLLNGGGDFRLASPSSEFMTLNVEATLGGLEILRNNTSTVALYIDDDTDYLSIGKNPLFNYATSLTHFEINQGPSKKALTINQTSRTGYWDMAIDGSNDNLRLYFNGTFKGEFSSLDGSYNPVIVIPRNVKTSVSKKIPLANAPQINDPIEFDNSHKYVMKLMEEIAILKQRVEDLESKLQ